MARLGRRPGPSGTREAILAAARRTFAQRGYDAATIRAVAADAGVDPALVHHFFGSKDQLFAAAMDLPQSPPQVLGQALEGPDAELGERMVRAFVTVWDQADVPPLMGLIRSATSNERAAAMLREWIHGEMAPPIVARLGVEDGDLRASLVGSQMLGLGMARYIVRIEPLASATPEEVVAAVAPTLQRYLTGPIG